MHHSLAAHNFLRLATFSGACLGALVLGATSCINPQSALERLSESRHLAGELLVQFTKAADAANRAVMADTDEASIAFAREARQATQAVQAGIDTLAPILQGLGYSDEIRLLEEFRRRFADYAALDGRILELAVENTNLKAQRLSFGPAQQAADGIRDSLEGLKPAPAADISRVEADVAGALLAVREIQVMQGPHIAEADDAAMTRLEERMATAQTRARHALERLESRIRPESRPQLAAARAALDRFNALNAEILALSRRNSNVRSLALSLGEKRTVTAACEDSLRALRDALAKRGFAGTR